MAVAEVYGGVYGGGGGDLRMVRAGGGGVTNMTRTRNSKGTRH